MKFDSLRGHFGAPTPTREETEADIARLRGEDSLEEEEMPKPNWPVYSLNVAESQQYLQDLLKYIVNSHLKVKQAEFK